MLKYIAKRLLFFIPTLVAISLLTFLISVNTPGDPVEGMLNSSSGGEAQNSEKQAMEKSYVELRHKLGFDLPVFYFSITTAATSDTINRVSNASHRDVLNRMAFQYGNWNSVSNYYSNLRKSEKAIYRVPKSDSITAALAEAKDYMNSLYMEYDELRIKLFIDRLSKLSSTNELFRPLIAPFNELQNSYQELIEQKTIYKRYIPTFYWHGSKNQYHRWLFGNAPWFSAGDYDQTKGFVRGDFGISYQDKRPVSSVIWSAMGWTMSLSILSMFFAYLIAIPLGVISAVSKGSLKEKSISTTLFMLYSLPNFWIATLAVIFLCGGDWFSVFPSPGADAPALDAPFSVWFPERAYRLLLPLICWTYGSFAFISRQMRGGMLGVLGQDFIRTARAKGLSERSVVWKHAFRNSLIPIITLFANVFPLVIGGSFVIEYIFSIPGMGKVALEALVARNYPVIFTIMMFTAILTLVGNLCADILYALVDPRISFNNKGS